MKTIIQYLYTSPALNPDEVPFTINTINQGIVQCKKLGWAPYALILGKKESEEIKGLTYTYSLIFKPDTTEEQIRQAEEKAQKDREKFGVTEFFGLKIKHNHEESYLGFQCQEWMLKETAEKLEKLFANNEKNS